MKWKTKKTWRERWEANEKRVIVVFLLFPREVNGETKWLVIAKIKQGIERCYDPLPYHVWVDEEWV